MESDETTPEIPARKRGRSRNGSSLESAGRAKPAGQNPGSGRHARNGKNGSSAGNLESTHLNNSHLNKLLKAMSAAGDGDFTVRLPVRDDDGILGKLAEKFNEVVERNEAMAREIARVEQAVRQEGLMTERATLLGANGGWRLILTSVNSLIGGLVQPTTEVARVISAVAEGDLSQKMALEIHGQPVKGEFRQRHGGSAQLLRLGSYPRGARSRHGRKARRSGRR